MTGRRRGATHDAFLEQLARERLEQRMVLARLRCVAHAVGHDHAARERPGMELGEPRVHLAQEPTAPDELQMELLRPVFLLATCAEVDASVS